jgi:short-subunit dehydrogenase
MAQELEREPGILRRVTLITGASGGIGADLARVFAREGRDLALVARSGDKLALLADEIEASGRRRPLLLPLDLTAAGATDALAAGLAAAQAAPDILVNNAGFGLIGDVAQLNAAEQLAIVDLNIRSLVEITLRFLPEIRAARGKILNVASVVSFFPGGPGMAVYYASKAFVLSFSLGLAQELRKDSVVVSTLCPGATPSGFQDRAGFGPEINLDKVPTTSSVVVAEAGYKGLMAGQREIIPGRINKIGTALLPFIPKSIVLTLISRMQQKRL